MGTDKDLRKLTKEDAINILVKMGEDPTKMRALKRWDRILLIREKSTQVHPLGQHALVYNPPCLYSLVYTPMVYTVYMYPHMHVLLPFV